MLITYFSGSKVVKNAVKKYGISYFAFRILEIYPNVVNKENNKELLDLEDYYLKLYLPDYNILTEAAIGYKHSEITRIKMKENYSPERRLAVGSLNKGRIYSDEERQRLGVIALNRKKAVYTE